MIFANVFVKKFNNLFIQEVFFILFRVVLVSLLRLMGKMIQKQMRQ